MLIAVINIFNRILMHIVKYSDPSSAASCAKTAERIEMQFGMLSQVRPGHVLHGNVHASTGRGTFEGIWPIEKHCKA